jgi:hypothetical protein
MYDKEHVLQQSKSTEQVLGVSTLRESIGAHCTCDLAHLPNVMPVSSQARLQVAGAGSRATTGIVAQKFVLAPITGEDFTALGRGCSALR